MVTYSFDTTTCTLTGPSPNGIRTIQLDSGKKSPNESITFVRSHPQNTITKGADGTIMHSVIAPGPGRVILRLETNSTAHQELSQLYREQSSAGAAFWGQNAI